MMDNCNSNNIHGVGYGGRVFGNFTHSGMLLNGTTGDTFGSGLCTEPLSTLYYRYKTFYWNSVDTSGTLTIQTQEIGGGWHNYDTQVFTSGVLATYILTAQATRVRLCNASGISGTINAWYVMRT